MLATLLTLCTALSAPGWAQDEEQELYMTDMAVTATLPDGWSVPRWSDWDLDAVDGRQTTEVHVGYTLFQVAPSKDAARVWAGQAAEALREKDHDRVEMVDTEVFEYKGVPVAQVELSYRYQGKQKAVAYQRSFNIDGRTVHIRASSLARNSGRAKAALDTWWDHLQVDKPAEDLSSLEGEVSSDAGFGSLLPPGWRTPARSEVNAVRRIAAEAGQGKLDKEICWVGIRPYAEGEAALLMACQHPLYTGIVDEHSFAGVAEEVRSKYFKGAEVPFPEPQTTGADQRLSFVYGLPDREGHALRIAATPYDQGYVMTVARGPAGDAAALDSALRAVLTSTSFADAEGGKHPAGVLEQADYWWTYRKGSPVVWGPLALLGVLVILGGAMLVGRKPKYDDI